MELLAERSRRQRMGAFGCAQSPVAPKETLGAFDFAQSPVASKETLGLGRKHSAL